MTFTKDFVFGVATSAGQVEGAALEDGRGLSIWDVFSRIPGTIIDGSKPDVACDMYHTWKDDIRSMKQMGVDSYRFSFSWSRILPDGKVGTINQKGLDYYKKLVDELHHYAWSLFDNWEWSGGYSMRFGLIHTDFETGKKIGRIAPIGIRNYYKSERSIERT